MKNWSDITPCNKINNNDGRPGTAVYFTFVQITHQSKKRAKIRNRYNQIPHLTQDTNSGFDRSFMPCLGFFYFRGNNLRHSMDVANTYYDAIFDLQGKFLPS